LRGSTRQTEAHLRRPTHLQQRPMTPLEYLFGLFIASLIIITVLAVVGVCAIGVALIIHCLTEKH
jgi:hypothetical protein